jgi:hypothetical protein
LAAKAAVVSFLLIETTSKPEFAAGDCASEVTETRITSPKDPDDFVHMALNIQAMEKVMGQAARHPAPRVLQ